MEPASSNIFTLLFLLACISCTLTVQGAHIRRGKANYIVRKCCASDEYYNIQVQQCLPKGNLATFSSFVQTRLISSGKVEDMVIITGRLLKCPDTEECFETVEITNNISHTLQPTGMVKENFFDVAYDIRNYCVESVGTSSNNVTLAIAFCLPETKFVPKCCPKNHFFNTKTFDCAPYPRNDESELLLSTFFYFKNEIFLRYQHDLECSQAFPIRLNALTGAYIDECSNICLKRSNKCYSIRKYCLDSAFTNRLEPSVYVCADNVTKVCCKNEHFEEKDIKCPCTNLNIN